MTPPNDGMAPGSAPETARMTRVLVPIRALQYTDRVIARVIELYRQAPVEVHLLNVQPPLPGHVAMFFSADEIRAFHCDDAREELHAARTTLIEAGIPFTCHVEVGDYVAAIAAFASEHRCRHVVLQDDRAGGLARFILGSAASRVRQLIDGSSALCELV